MKTNEKIDNKTLAREIAQHRDKRLKANVAYVGCIIKHEDLVAYAGRKCGQDFMKKLVANISYWFTTEATVTLLPNNSLVMFELSHIPNIFSSNIKVEAVSCGDWIPRVEYVDGK